MATKSRSDWAVVVLIVLIVIGYAILLPQWANQPVFAWVSLGAFVLMVLLRKLPTKGLNLFLSGLTVGSVFLALAPVITPMSYLGGIGVAALHVAVTLYLSSRNSRPETAAE